MGQTDTQERTEHEGTIVATHRAFITAIRLGQGDREEDIALCSVLYAPSMTYDLPPASVVTLIDQGTDFSVGGPTGPTAVVAVRPMGRTPHIRTEANGVATLDLLHLPRF